MTRAELIAMSVACTLRRIRTTAGLSQQELAAKSGVGMKSISSRETGDRTARMSLSELMKITEACGVSLVDFFGRVESTTDAAPQIATRSRSFAWEREQ